MQVFDINKANKGAKVEYLGREIELSVDRLRMAFETKSNVV